MADTKGGRVEVEEDVVFGKGDQRELRCDIYHPPQPGADRPALLLLHGGAWMQGDRKQLRGYGILLGRIGYVCVASEYRLTGEAKWPAQIHDTKAALRWMRAHHERLGIAPNKICVSGNSAGGHLALLAAGTPNDPRFEGEGGNPGVSTEVAACIAFYAPARLHGGEPARGGKYALFPTGVDDETVRRASPIEHVKADFPPTLLMHGNKDTLVPPSASTAMYDALDKAGAPVELHMFNGAPHGFDATRRLGRPSADTMALFLDRHVLNPEQSTTAPPT